MNEVPRPRLRAAIVGAGAALLSFVALGTVAALWPNPIFIRMTPTGSWEIGLLAVQSALLGLYLVVRRPTCPARMAGLGGVLNFLGVACPVCNKILLLLFGWDVLMTYYEPLRLYVAALGVAVTLFAASLEWMRQGRQVADLSGRNTLRQS